MTRARTHVSLVAIPDAVMSTLSGIYDVLSMFPAVSSVDAAVPAEPPFEVEIVSESGRPVTLASGLPIEVRRGIAEVKATDIVIVPSVIVGKGGWRTGRYPALVDWFKAMHDRGAALCSACSGIFLLAETGRFDGAPATIHWAYAREFRKAFPGIPIMPEKVLIATGDGQRLISSGASTSWHDLVLYLIARRVGLAAALAVARFYALEWHREGLAPYIVFVPARDHGDAAIRGCQEWLDTHYPVGSPVEEMARRSGLAPRTFKRRFVKATGVSPISYVQHLRIEAAKRKLEQTAAPVDEIGWQVGYEDPAFFRRLFKRIAGIAPGAYRRKFNFPDFTA